MKDKSRISDSACLECLSSQGFDALDLFRRDVRKCSVKERRGPPTFLLAICWHPFTSNGHRQKSLHPAIWLSSTSSYNYLPYPKLSSNNKYRFFSRPVSNVSFSTAAPLLLYETCSFDLQSTSQQVPTGLPNFLQLLFFLIYITK